MRRHRTVLLAFVMLLSVALPVAAQDASSAFDFWISQDLFHELLAQKSVLYSLDVTLTGRSNMHPLGPKSNDDCEMHLAGRPKKVRMLAPDGIVIEPPYICLDTNGPPVEATWAAFFDAHVISGDGGCRATGFPRILDEHLTGNESTSNPHHFFELHPLTGLTCGNQTVNFIPFMKYHEGSGEISKGSAQSCFKIKAQVRHRVVTIANKSVPRYEFKVSRPKTCGNFVSFEMSVFSEWIRAVDSSDVTESKGHSAIARVKPGDAEEFHTVKVYTIPGTAEDNELRKWGEEWRKHKAGQLADAKPHHGVFYYGVTTIDFYSIAKAVRDINMKFTFPKKWTAVEFPLAMVVYGTPADADPENDEGQDF
jgi:hypothetical protein